MNQMNHKRVARILKESEYPATFRLRENRGTAYDRHEDNPFYPDSIVIDDNTSYILIDSRKYPTNSWAVYKRDLLNINLEE